MIRLFGTIDVLTGPEFWVTNLFTESPSPIRSHRTSVTFVLADHCATLFSLVSQMILKRNSKQDRRRRQRQLLNTGVQVFTDSAHVDALGINLSDVGMRLFAVANLPLGSQIQVEFLPPDAQNGFEFVGLFAIALCIFTESNFWWTQINTEIVGPMSARLQAVRPLSPSGLVTDPEQPFDYCRKIAITLIEGF